VLLSGSCARTCCHTLASFACRRSASVHGPSSTPTRFTGQVMECGFSHRPLANNLAGPAFGEYERENNYVAPGLLLKIFLWGAIGRGVMLLLTTAS